MLRPLFFLLLLKALFIFLLQLYGGIGLGPDEAQYRDWSLQPDWGYYSKPPGIALQIGLGTKIFGENVWGVRSFSLLLGTLISLQIYYLCRKSGIGTKGAFWGAILFAFSPLGFMASSLAITDVGMVFFGLFSLIETADSIRQEKSPRYLLIGSAIAMSAFFKWSAYLFWLPIFLLMPRFPSLRSKKAAGGAVLSLVGFIPPLIWNFQHDGMTFRHVFDSIRGTSGGETFFQGNFFSFLGAQAALLSPLLFLLLILIFWTGFQKRKELPSPVLYCAEACLILLFPAIALSLFKKVQGNWADYAYPPAFVLLGYAAENFSFKKAAYIFSGVSAALLSLFVYTLPAIQSGNLMAKFPIPYKINPFRHNIGWESLQEALASVKYNPEEEFLLTGSYQMTAIMSFYGQDRIPAYFFNLFGTRNNHYSLQPGPDKEDKRKNGIFIMAENEPHLQQHKKNIPTYLRKLALHFDKVEYMGSFPLFKAYGKTCKAALLFKGTGYKGTLPDKTDRF